MLDHWREKIQDTPVCMMIPLEANEKAPEGWVDLDGKYQIWERGQDYRCFDALVARFQDERIRTWWTEWGGLIFPRLIQVPNVPSDEAYRQSFGIEPRPAQLKLILKVRSV